jgi:hypothetical protein
MRWDPENQVLENATSKRIFQNKTMETKVWLWRSYNLWRTARRLMNSGDGVSLFTDIKLLY